MNIRDDIDREFRRAVVDPQNIVKGDHNWDNSPHWDFVEADVLISVGLDRIIEEMGSLDEYYFYFFEIVARYRALETYSNDY